MPLPLENGSPVVSLQLRITAVQASLVAARVPERIVGAQGNYKRWGPYYRLCEGGSGGMPPGNFEILHALKCVLGASEAPFRACIQYIHTCQLASSFSGFRSKSTTYRSSHVRVCIFEVCVSSVGKKQKSRLT